MPGHVRDAANQVNVAAGDARRHMESLSAWGKSICKRVYDMLGTAQSDGITITVIGVPISIKLGQPEEGDVGPIIQRLRRLWEERNEDW